MLGEKTIFKREWPVCSTPSDILDKMYNQGKPQEGQLTRPRSVVNVPN